MWPFPQVQNGNKKLVHDFYAEFVKEKKKSNWLFIAYAMLNMHRVSDSQLPCLWFAMAGTIVETNIHQGNFSFALIPACIFPSEASQPTPAGMICAMQGILISGGMGKEWECALLLPRSAAGY